MHFLSCLLLLVASFGICLAQQGRQGVMRATPKMASVASVRTQHALQHQRGTAAASQQGSEAAGNVFIAPQCKCKDIEECSQELETKSNKCKALPRCEQFLKKIGNSLKIRACLEREQHEMERLEECVEKKVGGPIGCTNDDPPKNITISMMPPPEARGRGRRAAPKQTPPSLPPAPGHAPNEMSDYLMCVDDCTMDELNSAAESKTCAGQGSSTSCAMKLRCALEPPDAKGQKAFMECERELGLVAERRFKASCECLKAAGVKIECPK